MGRGSLLGPLADAELGEARLLRVALHPDAQLLRRHRLRRRPHRRESPHGFVGGAEAEVAGGAELDRGGYTIGLAISSSRDSCTVTDTWAVLRLGLRACTVVEQGEKGGLSKPRRSVAQVSHRRRKKQFGRIVEAHSMLILSTAVAVARIFPVSFFRFFRQISIEPSGPI